MARVGDLDRRLARLLGAAVGGDRVRRDRTRRTARASSRRRRSRWRRGRSWRRRPSAALATSPAPVSLTFIAVGLVGLGAVDVGPGGAVDDDVGADVADRLVDVGRIGDVELGARQRERLVVLRDAGVGHVEAEHPGGPRDQDLHGSAISDLSPTIMLIVRGIPSLRPSLTSRPSRLASSADVEPAHLGAGEQDRVLDLGALDHDVLVDRGVGADEGVGDHGAGADDRRAAHRSSARPARRRRSTTRPSTLESTHSPSFCGSMSSSTRRLASSMSASWPVSFHQPLTEWLSTREPESIRYWIASVISSSPRPEGSIAREASKIFGGEHVDADEGHVRGRVLRLLDQAHDLLAVELGDAVAPRVGHRGQQDRGVGLVRAEGLDQLGDAVAQQVVAEVHDEGRAADRLLGREHGVGEARAARPARRR